MKTSHLQPRACRGRGPAWGRVPVEHGVEFRLFGRDALGRSYVERRTFSNRTDRREIAVELRAARRQLAWSLRRVNAQAPPSFRVDYLGAWLDAGMPDHADPA